MSGLIRIGFCLGMGIEMGAMKRAEAGKRLPPGRGKELIDTLKARFERNPGRHEGLGWEPVNARLESHPEKLWSLLEMEQSGGKTSSRVKTPDDIRDLGGAFFGDRRFGRVFIDHNGAQSYYGARGFRACLRV